VAREAAPHAGRALAWNRTATRKEEQKFRDRFVINPNAFSKYCHNKTAGSRSIEGGVWPMKWQVASAAALMLAVLSFMASSIAAPSTASAEVRIFDDPGGEVFSYIRKFEAVRASGDQVVIDGPCLSACTLLTAL
jgi:hypothetical protein